MQNTFDGVTIAPLRDAAQWDEYVATHPRGTHAHLAAWRDVIRLAMGHTPLYHGSYDEAGSLTGVLPLIHVKSMLFGSRFVSVPFLNDGGPLGDESSVRLLREHAQKLAVRRRAALELRTRHGEIREAVRKVTVLLPLPADSDTLWSNLPSKVRSQVRRPEKAGMSTRFGADQLDSFYRVWSVNMRDLGTPVLPRRFFDIAAERLGDRMIVGCVYAGDVPVAAGAGFVFNGEFEITWASSLRSHNRDSPNMMLYWEFMKRSIERGATVFNFGRCTPGEGTHRFKLQWGGTDVPLAWESYGEAEDVDKGPGRATRSVSALWQRLPTSVANVAGPFVARQLPWW